MHSLARGLAGAALLTVAIGGTAAAQYPPSYADDMACRQYAQQAIVPIQNGRRVGNGSSAVEQSGLGVDYQERCGWCGHSMGIILLRGRRAR